MSKKQFKERHTISSSIITRIKTGLVAWGKKCCCSATNNLFLRYFYRQYFLCQCKLLKGQKQKTLLYRLISKFGTKNDCRTIVHFATIP